MKLNRGHSDSIMADQSDSAHVKYGRSMFYYIQIPLVRHYGISVSSIQFHFLSLKRSPDRWKIFMCEVKQMYEWCRWCAIWEEIKNKNDHDENIIWKYYIKILWSMLNFFVQLVFFERSISKITFTSALVDSF